MKKVIVSLVLGAMLLPMGVFAQGDYVAAHKYLATHTPDPWSTMGLVALGDYMPADYLRSFIGSHATDYEAAILAITALNEDPRTFGTMDFVAKLKTYDTNNQIGDESTVNDDIFGLLALLSAGLPTTDPVAADAKSFILAHQQANGGWGFQTSGGTDSNMTASAIAALIASGMSASDPVIQNGFTYLHTTQNNDGGFTYDPQSPWGTASDSSSTAWTIWAMNAAHINPADWAKDGGTPITYLESNQTADGYFQYQANSGEDSFSTITTAYAVIALTGKTLPLKIVPVPSASTSGGGGGGVTPPPNPAPTSPAPAPVSPPPVPTVLPGEVLGASIGQFLKAMDGTLALDTTDGRTVYMIGNNGIKRGFVSEEVFRVMGYSFDQVAKLNLTDYAVGPVINDVNAAHPDGTLVISGSTIWWINHSHRLGILSMDIFNSYGWTLTKVLQANAADLALPEGSTL